MVRWRITLAQAGNPQKPRMKALNCPSVWTSLPGSRRSFKLRYRVRECGYLDKWTGRGKRCSVSGSSLTSGNRAEEIWEGILVTYSLSSQGEFQPEEIEYRFVPDAYREWGLPVRDWKVQTSVVLDDDDDDKATFKTSRMLPSAGCEADDTVAYTETSYATTRFATESQETANFLCADCNPEDRNCTVEFIFTESQSARMRLKVHFDGASGPAPGVIRKVDQVFESMDEVVNEFSNKNKYSLDEEEIVDALKLSAAEAKSNEYSTLPLGVCVGRATENAGTSTLYCIWSTELQNRFIGRVEYDGTLLSTQVYKR